MSPLKRSCVALLWGLLVVGAPAAGQGASVHEVAITIDDPDLNADDTPLLSLDQRDEAIRQALGQEHLQAAIFVCGMRVDNPTGREHLLAWNRAGHLIGNHSYSHLYFPDAGFEQFSADVLRGDSVIANLSQFRRLFPCGSRLPAGICDDRPVKHTLLLHHNLLNALFLPDLFAMFQSRGWKLISASEALSDPVFSATPRMLCTRAEDV